MQIEELKRIVALTNKAQIVKELKERGYKNAAKSKRYRETSLTKIMEGAVRETDWICGANRLEYRGRIYMGVENVIFVSIAINRIDKKGETSLPYDLLWFFKED